MRIQDVLKLLVGLVFLATLPTGSAQRNRGRFSYAVIHIHVLAEYEAGEPDEGPARFTIAVRTVPVQNSENTRVWVSGVGFG